MKTPSAQEIKSAIKELSNADSLELILRLARFKKENKELLTYLLFNAGDEAGFIEEIKSELDKEFADVNRTNLYQAKKTIRKILRLINKYCRYTPVKTSELELRIYFCKKLRFINIGFERSQVLLNLYSGQVKKIRTTLDSLHEDLQFDYQDEVNLL
jgi:hypothetical protein